MMSFKSVDEYIRYHEQWEEELILLRELTHETELQETLKWSMPVYTVKKKNVVGIAAFKSYVGLWFYQGALLLDHESKLTNAQEEVTNAMRQWRFNSKKEILTNVETIRQYLDEAITNQLEGKIVAISPKKPLIIPDELQCELKQNLELGTAFERFSLYKKREFIDYIAQAKRAETKTRRIEKIKPMILDGIGLGDKYRK